jgi:hypothetical protein
MGRKARENPTRLKKRRSREDRKPCRFPCAELEGRAARPSRNIIVTPIILRCGNGRRVITGKLIATISDVAFEYSDDSDEAYHLAHMVLMEILKDASFTSDTFTRHSATVNYLH